MDVKGNLPINTIKRRLSAYLLLKPIRLINIKGTLVMCNEKQYGQDLFFFIYRTEPKRNNIKTICGYFISSIII